MKTFRIIELALATILLCLSACRKDSIEPTQKPEVITSEITIDANLISNGLSFSHEKGEQSISFSTNENWTLSIANTTSGTTWCTASSTSGSKGNANVKFTVTENEEYDDRSVSVTIKSGTATKTFKITQKCKDAILVTTNKYEVSQEGGTIDIEVKANINYKMEVSEAAKDWIKESSSRGFKTYKHTLEIAVNEESEKREGEIYFKSGDKMETVKVYQAGGAIILLSQDVYTVNNAGETISVDIKSNVDFGVQMPDVDWITDEATSRGLSSHTLKYVIKANDEYDNRSANIVFYDKNSELKDTVTIIQDGKFFETDYVDLNFDDTNVTTDYNATNGSLAITYASGNIPEVKTGNSIVLPAEYGFDIRVIESVSTSGNTLNLTTSQGNMANLFRNINFTLTTDPAISSRSAQDDNVYTPSAYGYIDENGRYHEVYNEKTDTRSTISVTKSFWEFNEDYNGEIIYSGKAGTVSWDKCEFSAGLEGTFTFDFGQKEVTGKKLPIGDLKKFSYNLTGTVGMDLMLHYNYQREYQESGDEIIKHNVIPTGVVRFTVGTVPVVIMVYTHLGKQYACQVEGELDATAGLYMGNEVSIGLEWTPSGGVVPTRNVTPTFGFHPLTVEAQASAEAKVSYYPQVEFGMYIFKGIWMEPRPYLKEKVEAGFRASTDGENHIGWKAETYNGMDIRMGLNMDFGFWDKEVWTSDIYNCVKDRLLFEAPSRILTLSPDNNIKVEKGDSIDAEFIVESFSPITNKYYPCPWALVNFEPESGKLDKKVAITGLDGKATVNWTPNPDMSASAQSRSEKMVERNLVAKVVDKKGESISESSLTIKVENEDDELREALIKLYQSTDGDNWTRNDNWCSDKPIEEWYGVNLSQKRQHIFIKKEHLQDYNGIYAHGYTINEGDYYINLSKNNLRGHISQKLPNDLSLIIDVSHNQLTSIDVLNNNSLTCLVSSYNKLTYLDIAECVSLKELHCSGNQLTSLDVSENIGLKTLVCTGNQLKFLDVSKCMYLQNLDCIQNRLTFLDVTKCTDLSYLFCDANQLTSLNVSGCTALESLSCSDNQLTSLDVSGCTALESLFCGFNQLTSLNVSGCTALKRLSCRDNNISSVIPDWFSQLDYSAYDTRFYYWTETVDGKTRTRYKDRGKGWWYLGEPERGYHKPY